MPVLIDDGDVIPPPPPTTTTATTTVTTTTAATATKTKTLEERGHSKTDSKRSSKLLQHRPGLNVPNIFFYFVMACWVPGVGCRGWGAGGGGGGGQQMLEFLLGPPIQALSRPNVA
jgi:hypothetical protein